MNQDRRHVAHELEELKARLLAMGGLAEDHLRRAMRGLVDRNHQWLADVIAADSRIDDLQMEIDNRCFTLIALHQPVALDLRTLVSAPRISADLERVGDLAVNISEVAQRYLLHPPVKPLVDLPRMGDLALKMLREALDAFLTGDVSLAKTALRQDDWLDALKDQVFREVLTHMLGDPQTIEPGVDLILMARHLERVGDHATSIAEDVIFIVEARDVRHLSTKPIATTKQAGGPAIERRKNSHISPV
jgi:phosphate transport system protein